MTKKKILQFAAIFLIGLALFAAGKYSKAAKRKALSESFVWNGEPYDIGGVNSFDARFARPYSKKLSKLGTLVVVLVMGAELCVVGALSIFPAKDKKKAVKGLFFDAFVFVNCWLWGNGVFQLLKTIAGRVRPYMYFDNPKKHAVKSGDFCRSWPSGHCSRAFIVFGFFFCWFLFRKKDSKMRIPAICAAFLLSVLVMFLRVHSGNHFVTDSLCGAAIGFLVSGAVFLVCEKVKNKE
ncbi:MAG: phosphatase PAP2 family protein [Treponema sp.]|nr:phosphatase PAP2 family protein [Treponema sp.]